MQVWSNGRFCNVKHRVQCKEASTRFSIATFMLGPRKGSVEAPAKVVDHDHPRLYQPFLFMKIIGSSKFPTRCTLVKPLSYYAWSSDLRRLVSNECIKSFRNISKYQLCA